MLGFKHKLAIVIATKDRPQELSRTLNSMTRQSCLPDQIMIVDGGDSTVESMADKFPILSIKYIRCYPPSATLQRNRGVKAINKNISLIGIMDDDIELAVDSMKNIMNYWENAGRTVGGAAFNMVNHPEIFASSIKAFSFISRFGLYSKQGGIVLPSGFHTMVGVTDNNVFTQWLGLGAVIWRRSVFDDFKFDEWFSGYSYLEDLDFSYRVSKRYKMLVVGDAKYYHYPGPTGRGSWFSFGKKEVINRVYFVRKNPELSLIKCYIALMLRILISFVMFLKQGNTGYLKRILGNLNGIINSFFMGKVYNPQ